MIRKTLSQSSKFGLIAISSYGQRYSRHSNYLVRKYHSYPAQSVYLTCPFRLPSPKTDSDASLKEILRALDDTLPPSERFIISDLKEDSVFIKSTSLSLVEKKVREYKEKLQYEPPKKDS